MNHLFIPYRYLLYWLKAVDQHSLHSPFLYNLYSTVINCRQTPASFKENEEIRNEIIRDETFINITDFGAGSLISSRKKRKVKSIARSGLSSPKFSQLLYKLVAYYQPEQIIELGTSLGINTLYLASYAPDIKVTTFEGCPETASYAQSVFKKSKKENISIIIGNIDEKLPNFLEQQKKVDLVFFDANHRYRPTMHYFELALQNIHHNSIFIFDDIHWSFEMEEAWKSIKKHQKVTMTVDIFDAGLVFFDPALTPANMVLEY
ncbi:class I SAM-dependent methyltransferase [soil metagenome]